MIKNRLFIVYILAMAFLSGCSHSKKLRADVDGIKSGIDSLNVAVMQINTTMANQHELLRLVRADQQVRFDELERDIAAIVGSLTESQVRLKQIDEKTRELKKGWEQKALADSLAEVARLAEIESLFEVAINDFNSGRRTVAISGFQDIIKRFPDSPRAEESQYWVGECYYFQKKYTEAEEMYLGYIKKYPLGANMCGTLFKLGLIYEIQKKKDSKKLVWEKVLVQCPESKETDIVQERLKSKK